MEKNKSKLIESFLVEDLESRLEFAKWEPADEPHSTPKLVQTF
jgi:hypothetical protein